MLVDLKVATWNAGKKQPCVPAALRDDGDIILVQEPARNSVTEEVYGSLRPIRQGQLLAYISKIIPGAQWDYQDRPDWICTVNSTVADFTPEGFATYIGPNCRCGR